MAAVDLNADLAEGETLTASDRGVLRWVTSVSLACGFHAGNRTVMRVTAAACVRRGIVIGAHVSFRDRAGFGRRILDVPPHRLAADIVEQVEVLAHQVDVAGGSVAYVKPHGALYNLMGTDPVTAGAVVEGVSRAGVTVLVAQPGTEVVTAAGRAGLRVVAEGFPDRGYLADGRLAPRGTDGALVDDPHRAGQRAVSLALEHGVEAVDGAWTPVTVETLCIHGDSPGAAATAAAVRGALETAGVEVAPFVSPDRGVDRRAVPDGPGGSGSVG